MDNTVLGSFFQILSHQGGEIRYIRLDMSRQCPVPSVEVRVVVPPTHGFGLSSNQTQGQIVSPASAVCSSRQKIKVLRRRTGMEDMYADWMEQTKAVLLGTLRTKKTNRNGHLPRSWQSCRPCYAPNHHVCLDVMNAPRTRLSLGRPKAPRQHDAIGRYRPYMFCPSKCFS